MLLLTLHRTARKLNFLRPYMLGMGAIGFCLTTWSVLVDSEFSNQYLELSIVTTLWGLMTFSFICLFRTIPDPVLPHDGFFRRLKTRVVLSLYTFMAALVLGISILLFWMSVRILFI